MAAAPNQQTDAAVDLLLQASGVSKRYGAVVALRDASLAVRRGEVHALMGANGAGKSTLVKILTGAVRPDSGTFRLRGEELAVHSPAEARRSGMVSVYQEPAIIPDLTVHQNLVLTDTPIDAFRSWADDLGIKTLNLNMYARDLPLAELRVLDLARALATEPDVLLLDEMTAALPADLTERVLDVVARERRTGRSVIFISHRLLEITALCDRATVLRDGETVGVVDIEAGAEEKIVELMLGPATETETAPAPETAAVTAQPADGATDADGAEAPARLAVRNLRAGARLRDVAFELRSGEVLGVAALEGQGQDELFDVLSGARRPAAGDLFVDGKPVRFAHPADAIAHGIVLVPADRAMALLAQRSVRENIALPLSAGIAGWGPINMGAEQERVSDAIERLQIDTRVQSEVQRLSGGNQQKVTIARWLASGMRTLLCFDPTRGIDIRTKRQIYALLRELAAGGAAVLLYTSELDEIPRVCDRTIVIYGGRVVEEMPASEADEPTLLRAAHGLETGAKSPEELAAEAAARRGASA